MFNKRIALLLLLGLSGAARADTLDIADAWIRATPPGATTAAGFVSIANGGESDRLIGAESGVAPRLELHTMVEREGMLHMQRIDALPLPAGSETVLAPGGNHIMFFDFAEPFVPGQTVKIVLVFERAGRKEVEFVVRDARSPQP